MNIGEFSKKTKLTIDTLRYYEKLGLINPQRSSSNKRIYTDKDIKWIEFIKRLKKTGMKMKLIVKYSKLRVVGTSTINQRISLLNEQKQKLNNLKDEINSSINFLNNKLKIYDKMKNKED